MGSKLFRQFCQKHNKNYFNYNEFLDAVEQYELEIEDSRPKGAAAIVKRYPIKYWAIYYNQYWRDICKRICVFVKCVSMNHLFLVFRFLTRPAISDSGVDTCEDSVLQSSSVEESFIDSLTEATIENVVANVESGQRDLFTGCVNEVKEHLSGDAFKEFKSSMYFHR